MGGGECDLRAMACGGGKARRGEHSSGSHPSGSRLVRLFPVSFCHTSASVGAPFLCLSARPSVCLSPFSACLPSCVLSSVLACGWCPVQGKAVWVVGWTGDGERGNDELVTALKQRTSGETRYTRCGPTLPHSRPLDRFEPESQRAVI